MQKYRPLLIIVLVLAMTIIGGALFLRSRRTNDFFAVLPTNSQYPSPGSTTANIPADVTVTLEEFGDYQCPPCGALHPGLKKLKQELGSNLKFVFRNLPLSTIHKNALVAAQAAEAARMQDRFWEMHDLLYENQDLWKDDVNPRTIFLKFASDLGLDSARFARDLDGKQVKLRIEADEAAATELGIDGTPTVLIEGRKMRPEVTNPEGIRKGIDFIMRRKASPAP